MTAAVTAGAVVVSCSPAQPDPPPRRISARGCLVARRDDPSEATADIAARMRADYDPWPTATGLTTTGPLETTVDRAQEATGPA